MHDDLITKVRAPAVVEPVRRTRLDDVLSAGVQGAVTVLATPAGWGKTTALAGWLHRRRRPPAAWLTLEPDDGGDRFWSHLHAAFATAGVDLPEPGLDPLDVHLARTASALSERDEPVLLVLDDFHRVHDHDAVDGLDFLLRHAGTALRLVVASRGRPFLPLQRWRFVGELTELGAGDLAFTAAEAGQLLAAHRLALPSADRDRLRERTEGWPAGLRLAVLALRAVLDPAALRFSGDEPPVADYFDDEVLAGLPPDVVDVLRSVSVLETMSGPLVDALTGRDDGEQILARLEHDNVFTVRLDGQPKWYRLHPLFAEMLGGQLRRASPETITELHRRAARWHETHGVVADALRHSLAASDWTAAAHLATERWSDLILCEHREPARLRPGGDPPDGTEPELMLAFAAERLESGDLDAAARNIGRAGQCLDRLPDPHRRRLALMIEAFRLSNARLRSDTAAVLRIAPRLLTLSDEPVDGAHTARAIAYAATGVAHFEAGELDAAQVALTHGLAAAEGLDLGCAMLLCTSHLALLHALRGELRLADATARTTLAMRPCPCQCRPAHSALAYLALAAVHYHWDRADEAARYVDLAERSDHRRSPTFALALALVSVWLLDGGSPRANRIDDDGPPWLQRWYAAAEADALAAEADALAAAARSSVFLAVPVARAHLQAGDPLAALAALPDWANDRTLFLPVRIDAGIVEALAADQSGDQPRAADALERALDLAEPDGFRRAFIRVGAQLYPLLSAHLSTTTTGHWSTVTALLDAIKQGPASGLTGPLAAPPTGPLTERELTVLQHLQGVQSISEIATALYLSTNTVKTHVRHIYRKLDAAHRREAVQRARDLRLL